MRLVSIGRAAIPGAAVLAGSFAFAVFGSTPAVSADADYDIPVVNGVPVDGCATWQADCGQPAADQFCRSQGYGRAGRWTWAYDLRTWNIGSNRYCDRSRDNIRCGGLRVVTCTGTLASAPAPSPTGTVDSRLTALSQRLNADEYARLYADLAVAIGRYGRQAGWIDGMDPRAPQNDPGRGVSSWDAHYGHGLRAAYSLASLISARLGALQQTLSANVRAQMEAEVSGLLSQRGG